ncbi:hypothetical protein CPB85DRAFT_1329304 [Mucidula mucida]|nr:hypothetical protein CPB85DRAFT_1329304 [Mucidula mucida]
MVRRLPSRLVPSGNLFTGFYAATAIMSVVLLIHKGLHNSYARMGLLLVTGIMFGLSTGHVYIYSRFCIFQFPTLSSDPAGYNPPWLEAEVEKLLRDGMILRRVSYFISDAVVVWRTWCIWYDNLWVRGYLVLVLAATGATSIATAVMDSKLNPLTSNMLGTFCLLVTNFSTTVLCAYKVWQYRRFIRSVYEGRRRKTLVENILLILVESGSLYCIFWLLFLLGDFGYFGNGPLGRSFGLEYFMPHFSGIYVSVIILVVALSNSSSEMIFSVVQEGMRGGETSPDGLEKMRFAAPVGSQLDASFTATRRNEATSVIALRELEGGHGKHNSPEEVQKVEV